MLATRGMRDDGRGARSGGALGAGDELAADDAAGKPGDVNGAVTKFVFLVWIRTRVHEHLPSVGGDGRRCNVQRRHAVRSNGRERGALCNESYGDVDGVSAGRTVQWPHARPVLRLQARRGAVLQQQVQGISGIVNRRQMQQGHHLVVFGVDIDAIGRQQKLQTLKSEVLCVGQGDHVQKQVRGGRAVTLSVDVCAEVDQHLDCIGVPVSHHTNA